MKRRWAAFHGQMRQLSGKRWQRVLGRILGENTLRYKVARFLGRPPLRALRKLRARPHRAEAVFLDVPLVHKGTEVFPKYYSPKSALRFVNLSLLEVPLDDVEVVIVDEESSSAAATVAQLNEACVATSKTWLLIHDVTTSEEERTTTLRALKSAVADGDDVVFADENGPEYLPADLSFGLRVAAHPSELQHGRTTGAASHLGAASSRRIPEWCRVGLRARCLPADSRRAAPNSITSRWSYPLDVR